MSPETKAIGPIEAFMTEDHVRLDALLRQSLLEGGRIDPVPYAAFREGLLRHIGMEEKVLLPFAKARRGGEPLPIAGALRKDHGAIAKLLVPTPDAGLVDELVAILGRHNALEEGPGALYAICDTLAGEEDGAALVRRLRAQPVVPVAAHYDGPLLRR